MPTKTAQQARSSILRIVIAVSLLESLLILLTLGFSWVDSIDKNWVNAVVAGVLFLAVVKILLFARTQVSSISIVASLLFSILAISALDVIPKMDGRERVSTLTHGLDVYRLSHVTRSGRYTVSRCKALVFRCEWVLRISRVPSGEATALSFDETRNEVQLINGERLIAVLWPARRCVEIDECDVFPETAR